MVVNAVVTPAISIYASPGDTVCTVHVVNYNSSSTGAGSAPAYQWYVNGAVAGTGSTYAYSALNADSIRCELTSSAACAVPPTVSSNSINMVVATLTHPTIALTGPAVSAIGSTVTITASVAAAGGSYSIQWFNHGILFTTTTVPSVTYTKTVAIDSVTAKVVSDDFCYDSTVSAAHMVWDQDVLVGSLQSAIGSLRIYPNPSRSVITIDFVRGSAVTVFNMVGVQVWNSGAASGNCVYRDSAEIDISGWPDGVYFVQALEPLSGERHVIRLQHISR